MDNLANDVATAYGAEDFDPKNWEGWFWVVWPPGAGRRARQHMAVRKNDGRWYSLCGRKRYRQKPPKTGPGPEPRCYYCRARLREPALRAH